MAKYSKFRKTLISSLCAVTLACTGFAAACSSDNPDDNKDDGKPFEKREDVQTLKNGNFEYYDYPSEKALADGKAAYLIKTPDNWSRSGDSAGTMSGIIGTSHAEWAALTADDLSDKLEENSELASDNENYVNYNGLRARDILYKDTYAALLDSSSVKNSYIKNQTYADYFGIYREGNETDGYTFHIGEGDNKVRVTIDESASDSDINSDAGWKNYEFYFESGKTVREELIKNPGTHYDIQYNESTGESTIVKGGNTITLKTDSATGSLYYTEGTGDDAEDIFVSNVLMLHNYDNDISSTGTTNSSKFNGIHQYYTSQTVTLEANTAAEISLWVKTSDLKFDKGYSQLNDHNRGAYIEVIQTVGGKSIDSTKIESINTEKIISESSTKIDSNGWLKYTIYVNACDFASSTVQIRLGLGDSDNYKKLAGYAFFDDVQINKYLSLDDADCTYGDNESEISEKTTCTLTSKDEDRIFVADRSLNGDNANRTYENFHYLIDLASSETVEHSYENVPLTTSNVTAAFTEHKATGKYYVSSKNFEGRANVTLNPNTAGADLPKNAEARLTKNDLLGLYAYNKTFAKDDFVNTGYDFKDYSKLLNDNLTGEEARLPGYNGDMLLMLSSRGAAYTSTIKSDNFSLASGEYMIVSFWVKTSDMKSNTAATVKLTTDDPDKSGSFSIDTTGMTTEFGDDDDVYNGWVQCFIFIENDSDEAEPQTFNLEFKFGNTTITSTTTYMGGWIALADMQTLKIDKDVYSLAPSDSNVLTYSFTKETEDDDGNAFDTESGTSDVKNGFANLANYNGYNGGSSAVSGNTYLPSFDAKNTNSQAGLLNRKYYDDYDDNLKLLISGAFTSSASATAKWDDVFGKDCYQPIIIINNIRTYTEKADATEDTYSLYYVLAEDGYTGDDLLILDGKRYKKATEWKEDETYYSFAVNYGYAGNYSTISANSCSTVTVKVKVAGDAKAWIYLVDNNREVLKYTASEYTFYYDADGNVLDQEYDSEWTKGGSTHREHIMYTRRDEDGLYNGKDNKVYYNLHNLIKKYDNYLFDIDNSYQFYDKDGNRVNVDDLEDNGEYFDKNGKIAPHFLANTSGKRIFEWKNEGYYFIDAEGKTTDIKVENFSDDYKRNYQSIDKEYAVCVGNTDGEWVTVNFIIQTGSLDKNYRLELWSGERGTTGIDVDASHNGKFASGAVAFDYCSYSVSNANFSTLLGEYESDIINEYKQLLIKHNKFGEISSNTENISYYEELLDGLVKDSASGITENEVKTIKDKYSAFYHAYSFYDSETYAPLTAAEAENYTYDATSDDYAESIAFMTYNTDNSINVFADYSVVDKSITPTATDDDNNTDTDDGATDDNNNDGANIWLYAASILLLVALLITLISIIARKVYKKLRPNIGNRKLKKNNYRQRERYIRKLHLVREETVEEPKTEPEETPAEQSEPEEVKNPAAEPEKTEETPSEVTEEPAAEPAEEPKADDGEEPKE